MLVPSPIGFNGGKIAQQGLLAALERSAEMGLINGLIQREIRIP
jgi:hypothetical protein